MIHHIYIYYMLKKTKLVKANREIVKCSEGIHDIWQ